MCAYNIRKLKNIAQVAPYISSESSARKKNKRIIIRVKVYFHFFSRQLAHREERKAKKYFSCSHRRKELFWNIPK